MGEDAGLGDGVGDGLGVIAWLYVLRAAICADGSGSLDLPNRAGIRRIRVARRMAIQWLKKLLQCLLVFQ